MQREYYSINVNTLGEWISWTLDRGWNEHRLFNANKCNRNEIWRQQITQTQNDKIEWTKKKTPNTFHKCTHIHTVWKSCKNGLKRMKRINFGWTFDARWCHLLFISLIFMALCYERTSYRSDDGMMPQQDTFKLHQHHHIISITMPIYSILHECLWIVNSNRTTKSICLCSNEFSELIISFLYH